MPESESWQNDEKGEKSRPEACWLLPEKVTGTFKRERSEDIARDSG
jgi:hypothetical protein